MNKQTFSNKNNIMSIQENNKQDKEKCAIHNTKQKGRSERLLHNKKLVLGYTFI